MTSISQKYENWLTLQEGIKRCTKCPLHRTLPWGRGGQCTLLPVPGYGNINANVMLVGECPGKDEIHQGKPFVGAAGGVLNRVLDDTGIKRDQLFVANTINCWSRSGNKNTPVKDWTIDKCKIWLWRQIKLVEPNYIITMGKVPTWTLLGGQLKKNQTMKSIIGKEHTVDWFEGAIIPSYHPSYVLRGSASALDSIISVFNYIKDVV